MEKQILYYILVPGQDNPQDLETKHVWHATDDTHNVHLFLENYEHNSTKVLYVGMNACCDLIVFILMIVVIFSEQKKLVLLCF